MTVTRPPQFDIDAAWAAYQALAKRFRDDPDLAPDVAFCAQMARAHRHWQNLFLAKDAA